MKFRVYRREGQPYTNTSKQITPHAKTMWFNNRWSGNASRRYEDLDIKRVPD